MKASKKPKDSQMSEELLASVRALISFPPEMYPTLKKIALRKRVLPAWVVHEAAEQYMAEERPFLRKSAT